jgi:hypothetical protein
MYDLPSLKNVQEVLVGEEVILEGEQPCFFIPTRQSTPDEPWRPKPGRGKMGLWATKISQET